jgi:hypothetical protein
MRCARAYRPCELPVARTHARTISIARAPTHCYTILLLLAGHCEASSWAQAMIPAAIDIYSARSCFDSAMVYVISEAGAIAGCRSIGIARYDRGGAWRVWVSSCLILLFFITCQALYVLLVPI